MFAWIKNLFEKIFNTEKIEKEKNIEEQVSSEKIIPEEPMNIIKEDPIVIIKETPIIKKEQDVKFVISNKEVKNNMKSRFLWMLDNGHGGIIDGKYQTPGKRSPVWPDGRQLFEGVFNREIVKRLSILLEKNNIDYRIIVPTQEDISLGERVRRINNIYSKNKNGVLLSIHSNAAGNSKATGWEVWTSKGETRSDKFATVFFSQAKKYLPGFPMRADMTDGDPDKESQFYILKNTLCPAFLTENLFMTTLRPDCEFLMSEEGMEIITKIHFKSIMEIEKTTEVF